MSVPLQAADRAVLAPGERLPAWHGVGTDRRFHASEAQLGRACVAVLAWHVPAEALHPLLAELGALAAAMAAFGADLLLLGDEDVVRGVAGSPAGGTRLVDCGGRFLAACGMAPGGAAVLVLDRTQRVARVLPAAPAAAAAVLVALAALAREAARTVVLPAPALLVPHLLPPETCRDLIAHFEASESIEGGVASEDAQGRPRSRLDQEKKRRRDLLIAPRDDWHAPLHAALLHRCAPEIRRAFQAHVTHTDRILVARYDAAGGWFQRHRDNVVANVAFREFAISVNLNAGEYDGGALMFPEYNDHAHCPPTGAGLIFSASLLHEAAPVTRGRRYVLLSFFHGDAAEARRRAYAAQSAAA